MTTAEKTAYIKSKCVEANPSIMDLVFGCHVILNGEMCKVWSICNKNDNRIELVSQNGHGVCFYTKGETRNHEIIGRPIRLTDVLLAILNGTNAAGEIELNGDKTLTIYADNPEIFADDENHWGSWNLKSDDLTLQSDETIDFLYQVMS